MQKLVGMRTLEGLKAYGDYWKEGTILAPEPGNEYSCSIWFEGGKPDEPKVRGCIGQGCTVLKRGTG